MTFSFQNSYDRNQLLRNLKNNFFPDDFSETYQNFDYNKLSNSNIRDVYFLGRSNSLNLPIFEVNHNSLNDPRVSLTKEAIRMLKHNYENQALIFFVPPDKKNYRISLVRIDWVNKEATNPRRYSFFVGENAKIHTVESKLNTKLTSSDDLFKRFSIEVVNDEFYKKILSKISLSKT